MPDGVVDGLPDLQAVLMHFDRALSGEALRQCAIAAAEPMLQEAERRAPVESGRLVSALEIVSSSHAASAVAVVQVASSGPGGSVREAIFSEYGTSKEAAKPWMRPAFEATKAQAAQIVSERLQALINNPGAV